MAAVPMAVDSAPGSLSLLRLARAGFGLGESARTADKKARSKNATFGVFERLYAEAYKEPNYAEKEWDKKVKSKVIGPQWRPSDGGKARFTGGGASGAPLVSTPTPLELRLCLATVCSISCFGLPPRVGRAGMGFH